MSDDLFTKEELHRMLDSIGVKYADNTGNKPGVYFSNGQYSTFADFIDPVKFLNELELDGPSDGSSYGGEYFLGTKDKGLVSCEKVNHSLADDTLRNYTGTKENNRLNESNGLSLDNLGRYAA